MSNLSDLIPAGASGKTIEAVATATIASKAPVILNSAGTVTEVSATTGTLAAGTAVQFTSGSAQSNSIAFDSSSNTVVLVTCDYGASGYGQAYVGTVSGTTISYAAPVTFNSGFTSQTSTAFDSDSNKVVVAWRDDSSGDDGFCVVGTVSGTTISFGTENNFSGTNAARMTATSVVFDSNSNKIVICYSDQGNSYYPTAIVGTISGTTISFGTKVQGASSAAWEVSAVFDSTSNQVVMFYRDNGNSNYPTAVVATVSGTSISFGTAVVAESVGSTTYGKCIGYHPVADKVLVAYTDPSDASAAVGTVSGTSISFGTPVADFTGENANGFQITYESLFQTLVISYANSQSSRGEVIQATISGTVPTFGTPITFETDNVSTERGIATCFDSSNNKVVTLFTNVTSSSDGEAVVITPGGTLSNVTAANFLGIADAAISSAATGTVVVQGGTASMVADTTYTVTVAGAKFVIDGVSQATLNLYEGSTYTFDQAEGTNATHPLRLSATSDGTHGSPAAQVFTSESSLDTPCITYDSTNNKIVIAYRYWTGSANVGAVIVGTVSGTSVTYGTPVVMPTSAVPTYTSITYDSNANRVVISYRDADNSDYGTSVVVTISGTTPSFGTPVVFESANAQYIATTFDSDSNKVVIAYQDVGNSSYGTAIVGTVSGTSISFGTAVPFVTANAEYIGCTFDSSNNKTVIAYKKNDGTGYGTGIVGTVSGTSISFGTPATFQSNPSNEIYAAFDSTANKTVFAYQLGDGSDYGNAVVGTVSGTSISFGAGNAFNSASTNNIGLAYDATADTTTIAFKKSSTTSYGTKIEGTISGTSISFGAEVVFEAATTTQCHLVYDPDQAKIVISYLVAATPAGKTIVYPVSEYTTGVTTNGTPGSAGAYTRIVVATSAPTLYYYCSNHSGYGGTANTPSFVTGSKYYVQDDGTITTVSSSVNAGLAISTTSLLLNGDS